MNRKKTISKSISYTGILMALNLVLLFSINYIPFNTLFIMAISSLFVAVIIIEFGLKVGFAYTVGINMLAFFVIYNKAQFIMYVLTFGIYGITKALIEKIDNIIVQGLVKLIYANIILAVVVYFVSQIVFLPELTVHLIIAFEIGFIVYDYVFSKGIDYYEEKLAKYIK